MLKNPQIAPQVTFLTIIALLILNGSPAACLDPLLEEAEKTPKVITVSKDGSGQFKTIIDAVESIPDKNTVRTILKISPGVYKEKVTVPRDKPFVTFLGTDPVNMPTLTFDGTALQYGTVGSASVAIESDYFVAANIIFENSSPKPDGVRKLAQAAAFRISGEKSAIYNCRFLGFQDTLCDDKGSHFFSNCYIEGTVDFIFGRGKSLYMGTELHSKATGPKDLVAITAHARQTEVDDSGYIFVNCKITGTGDIWLGRAWKERAKVMFLNTDMVANVNPEGWSPMNTKENLMYYREYNNRGPGANTAKRAPFSKLLTDAEAKPFLDKSYIGAATWLLPPPKP